MPHAVDHCPSRLTVERHADPARSAVCPVRSVRYVVRAGRRVIGVHALPADCDHADVVALLEAFYDRHLEHLEHLEHREHRARAASATPGAGAWYLRLAP